MLRRQLFWFVVVGGIGFLVDAAVLMAMIHAVRLDPYLSRVISFFLAASTTWLFNRWVTFRSPRRFGWKEWGTYVAFMALGGVINISVYSGVVRHWGTGHRILMLGLVLGTGTAMILNFLTARRVLS